MLREIANELRLIESHCEHQVHKRIKLIHIFEIPVRAVHEHRHEDVIVVSVFNSEDVGKADGDRADASKNCKVREELESPHRHYLVR